MQGSRIDPEMLPLPGHEQKVARPAGRGVAAGGFVERAGHGQPGVDRPPYKGCNLTGLLFRPEVARLAAPHEPQRADT